MKNFPTHIILHHTDDLSPDPQFQKVNMYHKSQKFPKSTLGFWCGYHYFIGKDGTVKQARDEQESGAHAVNCGCSTDKSGYEKDALNSHSIGICLAGNFTKEDPTDRQMASLHALVEDIENRWNIPSEKVLMHNEVKATTCPGTDLRDLLKKYDLHQMVLRLHVAIEALPRVTKSRQATLLRFIQRIKTLLSS